MTHGVAPCQTCGDHDESPDPISGIRWHVDAHRVEPEPGQAKPAGERDATETCRPAAGRRHKRASPERSSTASRVAGGVLWGTSAGRRGAVGEDARISQPKKLHSVLDWLAAREQGGEADLN